MKKKVLLASAVISALSLFAASEVASAAAQPTLNTLNKGVLTIGTDDPAYSPWFDNNTPSDGKGFESAIAYAVAKQLGYSAKQVKWVKASFNNVIAPGKKAFDFDINEVSITPDRAKVIDFSTGYYDVAQAVVTLKGSGIEKATSIAALAKVKLGAQVGTTSLTAINTLVKPKSAAAVYNSNDLATAALSAGQIKGLVLDLPTAFYVAATVKNAVLVGQFPTAPGSEQFGLVLSKGSSLTKPISAAVDVLRANGTLKALANKWLASTGGAPTFTK
jgi:polar amino acid transport system substrate-binding protein